MPRSERTRLLAEAELLDEILVSLAIARREVLQKPVSATDHEQKTAPRGVILLVRSKVVGQSGDPLRDDCDLDLWTADIFFVTSVRLNDAGFLGWSDGHSSNPVGVKPRLASSLLYKHLTTTHCVFPRNEESNILSDGPGRRNGWDRPFPDRNSPTVDPAILRRSPPFRRKRHHR